MARRRNLLHVNKVDDFALWMNTKGWCRKQTKGDYEVLRMTHTATSDPLIVYKKLNAEHCTVYGVHLHYVHKWLKERKEKRNG